MSPCYKKFGDTAFLLLLIMKLISLVSPCYNEEENILEFYRQVKEVFKRLPQYRYEHIFIDNASTDKTVDLLKGITQKDKNIKIIVNSRNFGHLRSPYYALFQTKGDAVILIVSDLQDPPYLIEGLIKKWEEGFRIVKAVKTNSKESPIMFLVRKAFYLFISKLAEIELTKNFNGFGLYDRLIIDTLKKIEDPYPYLRGLISDIGFESAIVNFEKPVRKKGITKNNFFTLYDVAMLGITNYSKVPLRAATLLGFGMSFLSFLVALGYVIYKIIFWQEFQLGMAPMIVGVFFLGSLQLFFIGVIGEYLGNIFTQVKKMPLVIEKERINFD